MSTDSSDKFALAISKYKEKEAEKHMCRAYANLMVNLNQGYLDIQEMEIPVFLGLLNVVHDMEKQAKKKAR